MTITISTSPFSPSCNSYVSQDEMSDYLLDRVSEATSDAWDELDDDVQITYLVNASRFMNTAVQWIGDRYSRDQKMAWPRVNAYFDGFLLDQISFPVRVKEATCEMARWMMENSGVISVGQNLQFDSIKVGPIAIDFNEGAGGVRNQYFPDVVAYLLADIGQVQPPDLPGANRAKMAKLFRA